MLRESGSRFVTQGAVLPGADSCSANVARVCGELPANLRLCLCRHAVPTSALELLNMEKQRRHIITFCAELDALLGGGMSPGEITECAALRSCVLVCAPHLRSCHRDAGSVADLASERRSCGALQPRTQGRVHITH